jgi:hypothetical protein
LSLLQADGRDRPDVAELNAAEGPPEGASSGELIDWLLRLGAGAAI